MEPPSSEKRVFFFFFFFEREKSFHDRERVEQKKKNASSRFFRGRAKEECTAAAEATLSGRRGASASLPPAGHQGEKQAPRTSARHCRNPQGRQNRLLLSFFQGRVGFARAHAQHLGPPEPREAGVVPPPEVALSSTGWHPAALATTPLRRYRGSRGNSPPPLRKGAEALGRSSSSAVGHHYLPVFAFGD